MCQMADSASCLYVPDESGEGGWCVGVYECTQANDKTRAFAVKVIDHFSYDDKQRRLLSNELEILCKLPKHTNLVQLEAIVVEPRSTFIVMPYYPQSEELFDTIVREHNTKNKVPELKQYDTDHLMQQLLSAVYHLHIHRIAHRDIKPGNVLFTAANKQHVTLLDFGLSTYYDGNVNISTTIVGTPDYFAPELVDIHCGFGYNYDARSADLWSRGVLLYNMCTGSPPFYKTDGSTIMDLYQSIWRGAYSHELLHNKGASRTSLKCLERLLRSNPRQRVPAGHLLKDVYGSDVGS